MFKTVNITMKTIIALLLLTVSVTLLASRWSSDATPVDTAVQFAHGTFDEILSRAKLENKIVFVDVYATWCGPCKLLKKTTFTDEELGAYFNTHFINIAIDGETSEGRRLMQLYQVRAYPTMLFLNPDGTLKQSTVGYHTANQLLKVAKRL